MTGGRTGISDWAPANMVRQGDLFETPRRIREEQVLDIMDQLRDRFGTDVVHHAGATGPKAETAQAQA